MDAHIHERGSSIARGALIRYSFLGIDIYEKPEIMRRNFFMSLSFPVRNNRYQEHSEGVLQWFTRRVTIF